MRAHRHSCTMMLITIIYRAQATEAKKVAEAAVKRAIDAENVANEAKKAWNCGICCERDFSTILVPCGHLLCAECVSSLHRQQCPFCRVRYTATHPVHR